VCVCVCVCVCVHLDCCVEESVPCCPLLGRRGEWPDVVASRRGHECTDLCGRWELRVVKVGSNLQVIGLVVRVGGCVRLGWRCRQSRLEPASDWIVRAGRWVVGCG
jgi:hypothetical protein